jgi:hypothetical protein
MQRRDFLGVMGGPAVWPLAARAQQSALPLNGLTADEAESIAQEAYTYFYPLVLMDVSRKHFTNIEPDKRTLNPEPASLLFAGSLRYGH